MTPDDLAAALRACAAGFYPLEAGTALLIANATFLHRSDFTARFIQHGTSISDGTTPMAAIDWDAAITALHVGELPCSGGERRVLELSASLAGGIPVDLRDAVTGLDDQNIGRLLAAVRHAAGKGRGARAARHGRDEKTAAAALNECGRRRSFTGDRNQGTPAGPGRT